MNNKINTIKDFIWSNIDGDGQVREECGYGCDIYELIRYVNNVYDCDITVKCCGGFDSPGYEVNCYAWVGIIDGELYFDTLEECIY